MKFNGALLLFNTCSQKHLSPLNFSLCSIGVACIYCLPVQVVKGDGGMDLSVYFKIVKIVMFVKTRDFVPTLTKAQ